MKVTVTTEPTLLKDLFTADQKKQIADLSPKESVNKIFVLSVVWSGTLYIENWKPANSTYSTPRTEQNGLLPVEVETFSELSVVWSATIDLRILAM
jgi:hypothetical protein